MIFKNCSDEDSKMGSRIEMLSHLPDLILGSESDEELLVRVASVLLRATPCCFGSSYCFQSIGNKRKGRRSDSGNLYLAL